MLYALVTVAAGAGAGAVLKSALGLVGFTKAGVASGSLAAMAQSAFYGGLVPAGGAFALLQSWGATMSAVSALKGAAMAVVASAWWVVGKSSEKLVNKYSESGWTLLTSLTNAAFGSGDSSYVFARQNATSS